ncbi:glycosyltransferase [Clostridium estertheticum]|uniref:glycosyltransferase n=1 Tax=Clostridium estertheticum TaxID=238834 RepID=UPI00124D4769|nr:glycosyltransferase [Clostridium estertheticum]MBZ9616147.1 glycosyltransferase [Clostridium estertheticum subsp. laramiense]WAG71896.1 glycosyltransferase [Clostridium estertheticum]
MKKIVISGINFFEGGALSVYKDCLDNIIKNKLNEVNNIVAFVHRKELFIEYADKITLVELPKSRKSYLYRLFYEYIYFYFYSIGKNIDVWLSLHDITPNVKANKRYVYCHNPSPFMKTEYKNIKYSYRNFLFSLFYRYLYKINIKKNTAVIVQQDWIRREFFKMYKVKNIIVARPAVTISECVYINNSNEPKNKYQFIYPSFPRFFKNFEVICMACEILERKGVIGYEVLLTIDGNENRYSKDLKKRFKKLQSVKFIGLQERKNLFDLYKTVDCMIFPSKLETWGLPISEFKGTGKSILVADLPYAHETVGNYDKVVFFDPNKPDELACLIKNQIRQENTYQDVVENKVMQPFARDWKELLEMILMSNVT